MSKEEKKCCYYCGASIGDNYRSWAKLVDTDHNTIVLVCFLCLNKHGFPEEFFSPKTEQSKTQIFTSIKDRWEILDLGE